MPLFEFRVILDGVTIIDDDACDRLFESGCDDSSPGSCNGVAFIDFHRESETLKTAIASAVTNIRDAGLEVARIESDEFQVIFDFNQQLLAS